MTPLVLTLITDPATQELTDDHISRARALLNTDAKTDWLATGEACDLLFQSDQPAAEISARFVDAFQSTTIDTICLAVAGRRKQILISDMDSTIIDQECIDELGEVIGVGPAIRDITRATVNGDISFSQGLRQRIALMKGMPQAVLNQVYSDRITLKPGARTLVQTMRKHGAYCSLVSGGFTYFSSRIATRVGFHDHLANELLFENGQLSGKVQEPVLGRTAKLDVLMRLCNERGLSPMDVAAIGDGANDISMISAAGLGAAFHATPVVQQSASARINHTALSSLLFAQGYRKSEFVDT